MDGHSSHYTKRLLDAAKLLNITIFGYPLHCTHALQGLDVACFGIMKEYFSQEIELFEEQHGYGITKDDFAGVFGRAFLRAFTKLTIMAAFAKTGIHPYNPDVIADSQMKPSQTTSIKASFPLPQASPVRAVYAALYDSPAPRSSLDTSTSTSEPSRSTLMTPHRAVSRAIHTPPPRTLFGRPQRKVHFATSPLKAGLNLSLEVGTPSTRRDAIFANTAATSAAVLVTDAQLTSDYPIIPPRLEPLLEFPSSPSAFATGSDIDVNQLAARLDKAHIFIEQQDKALRRQNAQLTVQNMHLRKLNGVLRAREKKKDSVRTKLFVEGKGKVLTDEDFVQAIGEMEARKQAEKAAKEAREDITVAWKEAKEAAEVKWKAIQESHQDAIVAWEATCQELLAQGKPKKDLPKKPKRPLKPKVPTKKELELAREKEHMAQEGNGSSGEEFFWSTDEAEDKQWASESEGNRSCDEA